MADEQKKPTGGKAAANRKKKLQEPQEPQQAQEILNNAAAQAAQEQQEPQDKVLERDPVTGNYVIRIDTGKYDPKLDPRSGEFDPELWKEANKGRNLNEVITELAAKMRGDADIIGQQYDPDTTAEAVQAALQEMHEGLTSIAQTVAAGVNGFRTFLNSDVWRDIQETMAYIVEHAPELTAGIDELQELEPYIEAELTKPEYNGVTLDELWAEDTDNETGEPIPGSRFDKVMTAARAARDAAELPHITITERGVAGVEYPLDKINANIWTLLKDADKNGQLTFAAEKRGSSKTADIIYSINFDELEAETGVTITKKLTAFDKRVYIAASALFNGGFEVVTVAQIYAAMGNSGRPNANDIKKINDSLTKMRAAHIYINNESEHALYNKYAKFVYDASLLPMERISAVVNGQTIDSAVHLFREPPLVTFAKDRKQVTTVSRQLLASPISKTDAHLQIDDYLIERISHIKKSKGKISNKLLYSTIFEKTGATSRNQKSRGKDTVKKYLEHYKQCGFIKGFSEAADGVTILY